MAEETPETIEATEAELFRRDAERFKLSDIGAALLRDANDAASAARNGWLGFLAVLAYLLVTLAGVTHKDLLLNSPVRLPIVNVDIPLFSFFIFGPLLLLLVLLSLLIQHAMLARKYRAFLTTITPYETQTGKEHSAREEVHSYIAAQRLAGPKRNLTTRFLTRLMLLVTFVILPVLTLLYFQLKFIPYHHVGVTYWHRVMVLVGLGLLIALLPIIQFKPRKTGISFGPNSETWRTSRYGFALATLFTVLALSFSWLIVTIPDERLDEVTEFMEDEDFTGPRDARKLVNPLVRLVYQATPQTHEGMNGWLLPWLISHRVLIVEDDDLVPDRDDQHSQNEVSVVLRGRNLEYARLRRTDLHRADLTDAKLRYTVLEETRLENAKFERADLRGANLALAKLQDADLLRVELQGADLRSAKLRGAILVSAELQGADLGHAELQGANLIHADLQGANLIRAELQGANLERAELQGAILKHAKLQGADLRHAKLQGADLLRAELQGANLRLAKLQGAGLEGTKLQGADVAYAKLQGAVLAYAKLQGANLLRADLQGANLRLAKLQGAALGGAELQGADLEGANLQGVTLANTGIWQASFPSNIAPHWPAPRGAANVELAPLTDKEKANLKKELHTSIDDSEILAHVMGRLEPILREQPPQWEDEDQWIELSTRPPLSVDEFASFLGELACNDKGGYIARSFAKRIIRGVQVSKILGNKSLGYARGLAKALLDEKCEGAKKLSDEMRTTLQNIVREGASVSAN